MKIINLLRSKDRESKLLGLELLSQEVILSKIERLSLYDDWRTIRYYIECFKNRNPNLSLNYTCHRICMILYKHSIDI